MKTKYNIIILVALVVVLVIILAVFGYGRSAKNEAPTFVTTVTTSTSTVTIVSPIPTPTPAPSVKKTGSITPPKTSTTYKKITIPPAGVAVYYLPASTTANLIHVRNPATNSSIYSPLTITGEAVGNWYFEGVFPVILSDWQGNVIASGQAKAQSDWMTTDFVPFITTLSFARQPSNSTGVLILKKDNPSGDPSRDAAIEILVRFQ